MSRPDWAGVATCGCSRHSGRGIVDVIAGVSAQPAQRRRPPSRIGSGCRHVTVGMAFLVLMKLRHWASTAFFDRPPAAQLPITGR
ncbi:hypothetical protein chiPu_0003563 [Chiloscyllium punctatum]|uniref:Uncharacterized protein n=1 Tax=Chiloscyllium punctatum TaxID=137246 RepID=A0A401S454_CHIPU|nr:hypothetical protein [Chiloscyllium punctatum]